MSAVIGRPTAGRTRVAPRNWRLAAAACWLLGQPLLACGHCRPGASHPSSRTSFAGGNRHSAPTAATQATVDQTGLQQGPCKAGSFLSARGKCVPVAWHCSPLSYGGGFIDGCDCACGAFDPDCELKGVRHYCGPWGVPAEVPNCQACSVPSK